MKTRNVSLLAFFLFAAFVGIAQTPDSTAAIQPAAVIEFKNTTFDFGTVEEGEIISFLYKFVNTGTVPLTLTDVKGSCGCTVPSWPKVPIMPGEGSEIEVAFNTKGKVGKQAKRITITANTEPSQTFLTLEGMVEGAAASPTGIPTVEDVQRDQDKQKIEELHPNCFALYPNPASDIVQLELKDHIGISAKVEIRDAAGTSLMTKTIDQISRESTQFDVHDYAPGVYMITIQIGEYAPMTQCFVVGGK